MTEENRSAELLLLGQIHGIVQGLKDGQLAQQKQLDEGFKRLDSRIDGIDSRLRVVENKAAVIGAVSGSAAGVGVALIVEALKSWLHGGHAP